MTRSYKAMARDLGIPLCSGMLPSGHYCRRDHQTGEVVDGTIHYREGPVTRANTFTFLRLVAVALDPTVNEDIPWRRVYRIARLANDAGRLVHARPGRLWNADKAFVLAGTAGLSNEVPMRKQAFDWARR